MSPKVAKAATASKSAAKPAKTEAKGKKAAPAAGAPAKGAKAAAPGKPAKGGKAAAAAAPEQPPVNPDGSPVDLDELEEQQDAAASATSGGGNAAAIAAAGTGTESASFKNFRHHPDMENFYRFIFENDLRHEALAIIDKMLKEKALKKAAKHAAK